MDEVKLPLPSSLQQIVGALLFGADRPLTVEDIRACLANVASNAGEEEPPRRDTATPPQEGNVLKLFAEASPREVTDALESIGKELARTGIGIEVVELNGGYRFQTQACCGRWVRDLLKIDRPNRLSRPALETLAIIAYRQPISKSEIESVRGVMVDHIVKALMELHLIRIVGRSDLPGRPFLYGTTNSFLEHFGLKNLNDLNELDPTLQRSKSSERKAVHKKEGRGERPASPEAVQEVLGVNEASAPNEPLYEKED